MELTTSFQSKLAKFETFLHFFSIRSAADAAAVRKGEERGEKGKLCSVTVHIFLEGNFTDHSSDSKKEEQFFIPKFHVDYNEVD